tara:strand:+ start:3660 stop:3851 length:192 start_codon:yes stop_codon:yes gene_type:complete
MERGRNFRPHGQVKTHHPKGTRCEGDGCTAFVSIYNDDTICASCYAKVPVAELPTAFGQFIGR